MNVIRDLCIEYVLYIRYAAQLSVTFVVSSGILNIRFCVPFSFYIGIIEI